MSGAAATMWKRFAAAALIVIFGAAAATATAGFLEAKGISDIFNEEGSLDPLSLGEEITPDEAGKPQTFLLLGSDKRFKADKRDARSDTIILLRMDPGKAGSSILSIPRDLKVEVPGYGTQKINAAFALGGPKLTLQTVKALTGLKINHLVNVNFGAFRRAVNYVGCVYADIDRRYFNDNSGGSNYATINVQPGYQKLCGKDALDYIRYRHEDSDLVRAARQQDFLRQAKDQVGVRRILSDKEDFVRIFARYAQTDRGLRSTKSILRLGTLALFSAARPLREVHFRADDQGDGSGYLVASQRQVDRTMRDFILGKASSGPRAPRIEPSRAERRAERKLRRKRRRPDITVAGLEDVRREGEDQAITAARKIDFPFYFPTRRTIGSRFSGTARTYSLRDLNGCPEKPKGPEPCGRRHRAYRIVVKAPGIGEYYGVQGTTWKNPPILARPSETTRVSGRKLYLFYDGRRLRLVAWRTNKAVYWVTNTLRQSISSKKLIGIAASLDRLG